MLPPIGPVKDSAIFGKALPFNEAYRRPVMFNLGVAVPGYACPHPDMDDPVTVEAGVRKRFACRPPDENKTVMDEFREFVSKWIRDNLTPLKANSDTSLDSWLATTNYPDWRKEQLRRKWDKCKGKLLPMHYLVKSFIKDETYPDFKHARGINSRSDEYKCAVGPIFKLIEREVFKLDYFIKKIPVADRPAYIMNKLYRVGALYFASDYTAFESLFDRELMEACEMQLYEYMTSNLPEASLFMAHINQLIGTNICFFKRLRVELEATRMSGEMCTSLGNGFTNLMIMLFMCQRKGCRDVDGVVEGDDSGFRIGEGIPPTEEDFLQLGLRIKIQVFQRLSEMSFCGMVFDVNDLINITDPSEVLATLGWGNSKYMFSNRSKQLMLLRCKALSLAHQYPGCPIVSSLAHYVIRVTRNIAVSKRFLDHMSCGMWLKDQYLEALRDEKNIKKRETGIKTRLLVDSLYGIPVSTQLAIESYLDQLNELVPLRNKHIIDIMPYNWGTYYNVYSKTVDKNSRFVNYPGIWSKLKDFKPEWIA